ncbi:MAG: mannose-1-phosphate guanylyltransferase [Tenacibaculum sp.]|nr:mannose-1-phosphate guanylyltransferase [Tenacibaculum sp.]
MNNNYYAVIMAGGVGSRFWPISTEEFPKQFHDMLGTGQSLIQRTFERINMLVPTKNILITTNESYKETVLKQLPKITPNQLLLEPVMRNTAPSILYSALKIYDKNPDAVMLVASSDHWITDEYEFLKNIKTAFESSINNDVLMTLGIEPDHPNTGYGYIKFDNEDNNPIKKVENFTEKPNLETAEKFIENKNYLWNAGIFVWSVKSIISAFKKHLPEMFNILNTDINVYNTNLEQDFIKNNYGKCENISIDFGIMERAKNVNVLPVNFGWSDLGTWNSLYNKLKKDEQNNAVIGASTIFRNSNGNIVKTQNDKRVVIQGLQDFIIVEKEDVLLICPRKEDQNIKEIIKQVKDTFKEDIA